MKIKKIIALVLAVCCLAVAFAACGGKTGKGDDPKSEGVMTYAEYQAAAVDSKVVVETFVQGKESWWSNKATFYTEDADGAYFLYDMPCTQEEYDKLVPGTKIKVEGYKSVWSGEIEITDAVFTIIEGSTYVATPLDVTDKLGTEELINYQNRLVTFKGVKVEKANEAGDAFIYNWDGSGLDGDDLYFNISYNENTYSFNVRKYLCDKDTDVYKAVKNLNVGDTVDLVGYLYWYEGPQARITSVTVK